MQFVYISSGRVIHRIFFETQKHFSLICESNKPRYRRCLFVHTMMDGDQVDWCD